MMLYIRPIAVSIAVVCFFAVSFIGSFCGFAPATCCRRAFFAAIAAYVVTALLVKAINAVLTSALISDYLNRLKEKNRAAGN